MTSRAQGDHGLYVIIDLVFSDSYSTSITMAGMRGVKIINPINFTGHGRGLFILFHLFNIFTLINFNFYFRMERK